ncbi:MAG: NAD(P)-dependent oxidoreductase, partial [Alphaproteobacteria bacterium]
MTTIQPPVGYIGLGLMGGPMSLRLLGAGYTVNVWNRSSDKMVKIVAAGAVPQTSPAAVAKASQFVFMCLTDTKAVEDVVFGKDGIASVPGAGKILCDFSSMRPDATQEFGNRLKLANGMGWVDAPVSGGVPGAEQGTLAIMAGGEAADVEQVRPAVMAMAQRFTHMGPAGAGQVTKLCNQIIVSSNMLTIAEAIAFAQKAGIAAERLPEALKGGFADSTPLQLLAPRFAKQQYDPPLGQLYTMVKDLATVRDTARKNGAPIPMVALVAEMMQNL